MSCVTRKTELSILADAINGLRSDVTALNLRMDDGLHRLEAVEGHFTQTTELKPEPVYADPIESINEELARDRGETKGDSQVTVLERVVRELTLENQKLITLNQEGVRRIQSLESENQLKEGNNDTWVAENHELRQKLQDSRNDTDGLQSALQAQLKRIQADEKIIHELKRRNVSLEDEAMRIRGEQYRDEAGSKQGAEPHPLEELAKIIGALLAGEVEVVKCS